MKEIALPVHNNHPFQDEPKELPKTRVEHLQMQIEWGEMQKSILNEERQALVRRIENIDGQISGIDQHRKTLERQIGDMVDAVYPIHS